MREICSKLKIKTPELCQGRSSGFLISNFKHISLSISKWLLGTFRYNHSHKKRKDSLETRAEPAVVSI